MGDVGEGLAGLASTGEDKALVQSVLDIEAARFSICVSHEGPVGTDAGGNVAVVRGKNGVREIAQERLMSASPKLCRFSVESVVGIAVVLLYSIPSWKSCRFHGGICVGVSWSLVQIQPRKIFTATVNTSQLLLASAEAKSVGEASNKNTNY